jgi:hypothetical protein
MSATITLTADPDTIHANDRNRARVVARVSDADGAPVPDGKTVRWTVAGQAQVDPPESTTANGAATTEVIPTGDTAPDTLTVTAETDDPIATATVTIQLA